VNGTFTERGQKTLKVNIPYRGSAGPLHLLIPSHGLQANHFRATDSTGIKVEGEGEWNARKHGGTKRRVWRKIHIRCPLLGHARMPCQATGRRMAHSPRGGIDEQTLEIRAAELTTSNVGDAPMLPELLNQIPADQEIASVTADGAFDTPNCFDAMAARGGVCQTSCPAISCGVSDFRGADFGFGVEPDGSGGLPVAGFA
jgi:hypothetical protein